MAAREDQTQPIIFEPAVVLRRLLLRRHLDAHASLPPLLDRPAPLQIDQSPPRHRRQPRARPTRHPLARPALQRPRHRILKRILREIEVSPRRPNQSREHNRPLTPKNLVEHCRCAQPITTPARGRKSKPTSSLKSSEVKTKRSRPWGVEDPAHAFRNRRCAGEFTS